MNRWGVWTDGDGGFLTDACHTEAEAAGIRDDMIDAARQQGDADDAADMAADLTVIRMCDDHDDQPDAGCDECDTEDDDDTEED